MRRELLISLTLLAACTCRAQTYPEKDGSTYIAYRIMSAYTPYQEARMMLTDNMQARNEYPFTIKGYDADSRVQEWVLQSVSAGDETYLLRNKATMRYVGTTTSLVGDFYINAFSTKKSDTNAIRINDIGNGQVTLSYETDGGRQYLTALDADSHMPEVSMQDLRNSICAWRICTSSDFANGITAASPGDISVVVRGRIVTVTGARDWQVYDLSGCEMPQGTALQPGAYIVHANGVVKKVMVK